MEYKFHTLGHERAVERLVHRVEAGETVFRALPSGYRVFESMRRFINHNTIPRRDERTEIYNEAQRRLGGAALFTVLLMWVSRDDHDEPPGNLEPLPTKLVSPLKPIPKIDYNYGKIALHSHIDIAVVTHYKDEPTGARLSPHDTQIYRAFSLMFGDEPEGQYSSRYSNNDYHRFG